ncbi:hypothetical protein BKA70DRAFT_97644 [Coprinopsis sp. MPI-PUGE-AT-0042]|nr:hypothetical protein BKA70DRAFT_97644 [Coprinopsis sp. MPI-PUGE-AT-0042]
MLLERERRDDWGEVTKPLATVKASTSHIAASSAIQRNLPILKLLIQKVLSPTAYLLYPTCPPAAIPAPIEVLITPPAKKSPTAANQHPMLTSIKSHSGGPAYPLINVYASISTAPLPTAPAASQSSSPAKKSARGRKQANAAAEDSETTGHPEKRMVRFKHACPNNITERLARVRERTF